MEIVNKTLLGNDNYDIILSKCDEISYNKLSLTHSTEIVAILPYTKSEGDIIDRIGIISEFNPFRKNDSYVIIEYEKDEDDSSLDTAIRSLCEKTGYDITDESKWTFLKELYTDKFINSSYTCYSVDISDYINETESINDEFKLVSISQIIAGDDSLAIALLMKLYISVYGNIFKLKQNSNL